MGIDFADYDNDGWPDIVVTDLANQRYALYHNNRDGTFDYASLASGMGAMSQLHSGWGARFVDYDNDGWKDLLVAQGHDMDNIELVSPQFHYREPVMLLRNAGGKFVDVAGVSGEIFHDAWVGRGLAIGDIDNDGRIDAVVTTNGGARSYSAQRNCHCEPLAHAAPGGTQKQPGRDRGGGQTGDERGAAMGHGYDLRKLSFGQ